jgi:hypothetical protein
MQDEDSFDYIVVGAGIVLAVRLLLASQVHLLPTVRVALLESGKEYFGYNDDFNAIISDPKKFGSAWDRPAERGYRTVPQKGPEPSTSGSFARKWSGWLQLDQCNMMVSGFQG